MGLGGVAGTVVSLILLAFAIRFTGSMHRACRRAERGDVSPDVADIEWTILRRSHGTKGTRKLRAKECLYSVCSFRLRQSQRSGESQQIHVAW